MAVLRPRKRNANDLHNNQYQSVAKPTSDHDHHDHDKLRINRKRSKKNSSETAAISKFMSFPDDLMLEIFFRISDLRHAITVCKRWSSLISGVGFPEGFVRHRHLRKPPYNSTLSDPSYSPPYTLLLRYGTGKHCGQILSGKSKILHEIFRKKPHRSPRKYLGFLPNQRNLVVRSSFEDLLLLSSGWRKYYIANPVTREWAALPEAPPMLRDLRCIRCDLLCLREPAGTYDDLTFRNAQYYQYRVVVFSEGRDGGEFAGSRLTVFCSETGQWRVERRSADIVWMNSDFAATSDGVLHWPAWGRKGFYAFDPFKAPNDPARCRSIKLFPDGFRGCGQWPRQLRIKLRLGVVKGRLRASELLLRKKKRYDLRIWELSYDDDDDDQSNDNNNNIEGMKSYSWELVHQVSFKKKKKTKRVMVIAFHPDNGNVIFLLRDLRIFRYEIMENRYKRIGKLSSEDFPNGITGVVPVFLRAFSLMHPQWPTQVPALPSI